MAIRNISTRLNTIKSICQKDRDKALQARNTLDQINHHGIHDGRRYGISPLQGFIIFFCFDGRCPSLTDYAPLGLFNSPAKAFAGWISLIHPSHLSSAGRWFPVQYGEINIPQTQSPVRAKYISIGR